MMAHLHRGYYVALLTAAAMHGAAHQAPQSFQVITEKDVPDRDLDATACASTPLATCATP